MACLKVINAVGSHHAEMEQASLEAVLVQAADAISVPVRGHAANRSRTISAHKALEQVANSFQGSIRPLPSAGVRFHHRQARRN